MQAIGSTIVFLIGLVILSPDNVKLAVFSIAIILTSVTAGSVMLRYVRMDCNFVFAIPLGYALIAGISVLLELIGPSLPLIAFLPAAALPLLLIFRKIVFDRNSILLAAACAIVTVAWNFDLNQRLVNYHAGGQLAFWVDILAHAVSIGQFGSEHAVTGGAPLMAGYPRQFYHYGTYIPIGTLVRAFGAPFLEAAILSWLPLGIIVMFSGIAQLAYTLGGLRFAIVAIIAFCLMPDPSITSQNNGFVSFTWLVEVAPGIPYSIGISCACIAMFIHGLRSRSITVTIVSVAFGIATAFIRFNTAVWLVPSLVLAASMLSDLPRPLQASLGPPLSARRLILTLLLFMAMLIAVAAMSSTALSTDARQFLFSYTNGVLSAHEPARFIGAFKTILGYNHLVASLFVGPPLMIVAFCGAWLVVAAIGLWHSRTKRTTNSEDLIPAVFLLVACAGMLIGPIPANGDISEFRHRGFPLIVAVIAIWASYFVFRNFRYLDTIRPRFLFAGLIAAAAALSLQIGALKKPRMLWAKDYYSIDVDPATRTLAQLIKANADIAPSDGSILVARQDLGARLIDQSVKLTALTGRPAFIACPALFWAIGGKVAAELKRRLSINDAMAGARDTAAIQSQMEMENIAFYITDQPQFSTLEDSGSMRLHREGAYTIFVRQARH